MFLPVARSSVGGPLVKDPPTTPIFTLFFPSATILKSGSAFGNCWPTLTSREEPFSLISAAFGGTRLAVNVTGVVGFAGADAGAGAGELAVLDVVVAGSIAGSAGSACVPVGSVSVPEGVEAGAAAGAVAGAVGVDPSAPVYRACVSVVTCARNGSLSAKRRKLLS